MIADFVLVVGGLAALLAFIGFVADELESRWRRYQIRKGVDDVHKM